MTRLSILIGLLILTAKSFEQTIPRHVIASAGNSVFLSDISISSTVGQTPFLTLSDQSHFLTQGFQQPTLRINPNNVPFGEFIQVYPNPVIDYLTLILSLNESKDFYIKIYTLTGYEVQSVFAPRLENGLPYKLDFSSLPDGMYLLYIYEAALERNLYKVIKVEKFAKPIE